MAAALYKRGGGPAGARRFMAGRGAFADARARRSAVRTSLLQGECRRFESCRAHSLRSRSRHLRGWRRGSCRAHSFSPLDAKGGREARGSGRVSVRHARAASAWRGTAPARRPWPGWHPQRNVTARVLALGRGPPLPRVARDGFGSALRCGSSHGAAFRAKWRTSMYFISRFPWETAGVEARMESECPST